MITRGMRIKSPDTQRKKGFIKSPDIQRKKGFFAACRLL